MGFLPVGFEPTAYAIPPIVHIVQARGLEPPIPFRVRLSTVCVCLLRHACVRQTGVEPALSEETNILGVRRLPVTPLTHM